MKLRTLTLAVLSACVVVPAAAFAYGEDDAIRDCDNRLRDEYKLTDFRGQSAERLTDVAHHYKVTGRTKIDGQAHPYGCEIKNRHVVSVDYSGPEPEGLDTAQKLAIGAAAAVAAGVAISQMSKDEDAQGASAAAEQAPAAGGGDYPYRCKVRDKATSETRTLACDMSQHQGYVRIYLEDGAEIDLEPIGDKPGNFRLAINGDRVYRKSGLGDKGVIYDFPDETISIYY